MPSSFGQITSQAFNATASYEARGKWTSALTIYQKTISCKKHVQNERERTREKEKERDRQRQREGKGEGL